MTEILDENIDLSRESVLISSSSSSRNFLRELRMGLKGKEIKGEGFSLSQKIEKSFGISYKESKTIKELHYLSKHSQIIDEMNNQRAFTAPYLCRVLERNDNDKTVRNIISILIKRKILNMVPWIGKARRTYGVTVYYADNANQEDVDSCLLELAAFDELRYEKQQKYKKSSEDIKEETRIRIKAQIEGAELAKQEIEKPMTNQEKAKIELSKIEIQEDIDKLQSFDVEVHQQSCTTCQDIANSKEFLRTHLAICEFCLNKVMIGSPKRCDQFQSHQKLIVCGCITLTNLELNKDQQIDLSKKKILKQVAKLPDNLNKELIGGSGLLKLMKADHENDPYALPSKTSLYDPEFIHQEKKVILPKEEK